MSTIGDVLQWQGVAQFFSNAVCVKCAKKIENGTYGVQFVTRVGKNAYKLEYCLNCGMAEVEEEIRLYKHLRERIKMHKEGV